MFSVYLTLKPSNIYLFVSRYFLLTGAIQQWNSLSPSVVNSQTTEKLRALLFSKTHSRKKILVCVCVCVRVCVRACVCVFYYVFFFKFQTRTPWRNDQNLIEPALQEKKKVNTRMKCSISFGYALINSYSVQGLSVYNNIINEAWITCE